MSNHAPQITAGEAAFTLRRLLEHPNATNTMKRRFKSLLSATEAAGPDALTLDYLTVRTATVGDGPSATTSLRKFREYLGTDSRDLGVPLSLEVDGNKKRGAEGRRCWFPGRSQQGYELSTTSAALTSSVERETLVNAEALPQDAAEAAARTADKDITLWVHLDHDTATTGVAEKLEDLLHERLVTNDKLAEHGLGVRISNSHLLAGQSAEHLHDRRQQAAIIVPLVTHKWFASQRAAPLPGDVQLVPVCAEPMKTQVKH